MKDARDLRGGCCITWLMSRSVILDLASAAFIQRREDALFLVGRFWDVHRWPVFSLATEEFSTFTTFRNGIQN